MKTVHLLLAATSLSLPARAHAEGDNKILDAVRQLDVENDNHWTADGLPRLETVKMLASDSTINREAVEAAAPGFKRDTATGYADKTVATSAPQPNLQGDGAQGNGAGAQGTQDAGANAAEQQNQAPPAPPLTPSTPAAPTIAQAPMVPQEQRDTMTPVTAPSADSLRGTDNDTLREQQSQPGPNNLNAEGGPSDGPSVPDEVQAAAAVGAPAVGLPPEVTQGTTMQGANTLATPESDAFDAAITTAHGPNTPWGLGGSREGGVPAGQSAEDPTSPEQGLTAAAGDPSQTQLHTVEHGTAGDPDSLESLEAELVEAEAASASLRATADEANAELNKAVAREVALRGQIEAARPRGGTMPAIQSYFEATDKIASQQAAARRVLEEGGLDLKKVKSIFGEA